MLAYSLPRLNVAAACCCCCFYSCCCCCSCSWGKKYECEHETVSGCRAFASGLVWGEFLVRFQSAVLLSSSRSSVGAESHVFRIFLPPPPQSRLPFPVSLVMSCLSASATATAVAACCCLWSASCLIIAFHPSFSFSFPFASAAGFLVIFGHRGWSESRRRCSFWERRRLAASRIPRIESFPS